MDTTKQLTVEQIQGYLAKGIVLLPFVYEHYLTCLNSKSQDGQACLLPSAIFDLYHIRLKSKLIHRIAQQQARKRKAA